MSRSQVLLSAQQNWMLSLACIIWTSEVVIAVVLICRWTTGAFTNAASWQFGGLFVLLASIFACTARYFAHQQIAQSTEQNRYLTRHTITADLLTILPPIICGISLLALDSTFQICSLMTLAAVLSVATFFVSEAAHEKAVCYLKIIAFGESALADIKKQKSAEEEAPLLDDSIDNAMEAKLQNLLSSEESTPMPEASTDQILQTQTRSISPEGCETITGTLHVDMTVGERNRIAHVPFEPAFSEKPEVSVEVNGMFAARVTPAAVHNYGIRLEIRLSEPACEQGVVNITYRATAPQNA